MKTTAIHSSRQELTFLQNDLTVLHQLAQKTSDPLQLEIILKRAQEKHDLLTAKLRENTPSSSLAEKASILTPASATQDKDAIQKTASQQLEAIRAKVAQVKKNMPAATTVAQVKQNASTATPYQSNYSVTRSITPIASKTPAAPKSTYSITGGILTAVPKTTTPSASKTQAPQIILPPRVVPTCAVGFGNESNNCWCNSLLQMIIHVPSFRAAYEAFAQYQINYANSSEGSRQGTALLKALDDYASSLQARVPVPKSVSQSVRGAFHHFFPSISPSSARTEDAYEALQLLMGGYSAIIRQQHLAPMPALYTPLKTQRIYEPQGSPFAAIPERLEATRRFPSSDLAYSRIADDFSSSKTDEEYQIFLDMQGLSQLGFDHLLRAYFHTEHNASDPATYLRSNDQLQNFKLTREHRQFERLPQQLVLTVKRFGFNRATNSGFKITDPLAIPRSFTLPQEATRAGERPTYELDFFIVHTGGIGGGHYLCYRKIDGIWIECNDSGVREVSIADIDQVLNNPSRSSRTSYIHHYTLRQQAASQEIPAASSSSASAPQPIVSPLQAPQASSTEKPLSASIPAPALQQPSMQALQPPAKKTPAVLFPNQDVLTALAKQIADLEIEQKALEKLNQLIQTPSVSVETINQHLAASPQQLLLTLDYLIWMNGKAPAASNYGAYIRKTNPRHLAQINLPWVLDTGSHLIDQLTSLKKSKKKIALLELESCQLDNLLQALASGKQIQDAFEALEKSVQKEICHLVYLSHKMKYGEAVVNAPQYGNKYGEMILEEQGIGEILLNAKENVINAHGNIIEQLKREKETQKNQEENTLDRKTLGAYLKLLKYPAAQVTSQQLYLAFTHLDASHDLKERLLNVASIASELSQLNGEEGFERNPRQLLTIKEPLLAGPPIAPNGTSLIEQMIALLNSSH